MNKSRAVSIVTVNLNNRDGLIKTANSIVSQTAFSNIEWIIIDGGSDDGSLEIINHYIPQIDYWVSEVDTGIYNAMNKGISQAHGKYILFLNSGDFLYSDNVIERFIEFEEFGKFDYLVGKIVTSQYNREMGSISPPSKLTGRYLLESFLPHPSQFIKRERFVSVRYDESYKIAADRKLVAYDVIRNNATYAPLPFIVSNFDSSGVSATHHNVAERECQRIIHEVLPVVCVADYEDLMTRDSLLVRISKKINSYIAFNFVLTVVAGILFAPIWLVETTKRKWNHK